MHSNIVWLAQVRSQSESNITIQTAVSPDQATQGHARMEKNTAFQHKVWLKLRLLRWVRNRIRIVIAMGITLQLMINDSRRVQQSLVPILANSTCFLGSIFDQVKVKKSCHEAFLRKKKTKENSSNTTNNMAISITPLVINLFRTCRLTSTLEYPCGSNEHKHLTWN